MKGPNKRTKDIAEVLKIYFRFTSMCLTISFKLFWRFLETENKGLYTSQTAAWGECLGSVCPHKEKKESFWLWGWNSLSGKTLYQFHSSQILPSPLHPGGLLRTVVMSLGVYIDAYKWSRKWIFLWSQTIRLNPFTITFFPLNQIMSHYTFWIL